MTRLLAIGDIHGCFTALRTLLDFVEIQPNDKIVTLGDYIDRGPNSCQVLDWLIEFDATGQLIPIRGNHEQMMLNARDDFTERRRWALSGANDTLDSYTADRRGIDIHEIPERHWDFVEKRLLPYYETDSFIFVHAGVEPDLPMAEQKASTLYWRPFTIDCLGHFSGKIVVCGHVSQPDRRPVSNGKSICIDTAAWDHGWLTCLEVDSGKVWQANESGETREM